MKTIARLLHIREHDNFFLWGPRQTGKTFHLKSAFGDARWVNLLENDTFVKYSTAPHLLREELREDRVPTSRRVIIDEVQKVPALLDEVHLMIEEDRVKFGLCGSSARKVRRGHANLLGGRAIRYEMHGFSGAELGDDFDLGRVCNVGYLPNAYLGDDAPRFLNAYVMDYLKEEIANEGLVRKLPAFADFLRAAALCDTELVSYTNIASDCGVSKSCAQGYYEVLVDTLLGSFLPAYTRRPKRRVVHAPKFYFFDVGVVNVLAKRGPLEVGSELFGKAFENFVHHELRTFSAYKERNLDFSYWRLTSGAEVDFIVNDMEVAIEAKGVARVDARDVKGLRELRRDHPEVRERIVVCAERTSRRTDDGIRVLTAADFLAELWSGAIV